MSRTKQKSGKKAACSFMVLILWLQLGCQALATNGMNMIGYSVRSSGMGGSDVAVGADCSGSSCNPATQGRSGSRSLAMGVSVLMPELSIESGNDHGAAKDHFYPLPYVSYVQPLSETSPWILGFNVYAQGGMGVDFQDVSTFAGTEDSVESLISYVRLTGTGNYSVSDKLSIGFGLMAGYVDLNFSVFPDTYSVGQDGSPGTADDFWGIDARGFNSYGIAGRLGLHYKVTDGVSLGLQYTSEAVLDPDGGELVLNLGEQKVSYDAEIESFTWPREFEFGVAVQATPYLLIAADVKWINWSSAINVLTVRGKGPGATVSLAEPEFDFNMKWRDQWVFAIGAEYAIDGKHTVRVGYNYGKNPVPDSNLSPLFPAIVEHHVTLGYGYSWGKWAIDCAYEHAFENEQTNFSPGPPLDPDGIASPFLSGVKVGHRQDTVHLVLTYYY